MTNAIKSADADSYKAAGVMRPKTRRRFTQINSKCLAGGYKHAIIMTIIALGNKNTVLRKENQMKTKESI